MNPMIEIHYLSGRKRRVPESAFVDQGEVMANVLDIGFEDLSDGLKLYYRHYEPKRADITDLDYVPDPNGLESILFNDGSANIIPKCDIPKIEKVFYEGKLELARFSPGGELVNLHKVNSAQALYLSGQGEANTRLLIAELFAAMKAEFKERDGSFKDDASLDGAVRTDLGVSETVLDECIAFQKAYALGHPDYAREHKLPYVDSEGVMHNSEDGGGMSADEEQGPEGAGLPDFG